MEVDNQGFKKKHSSRLVGAAKVGSQGDRTRGKPAAS